MGNDNGGNGVELNFAKSIITPSEGRIRRFGDIPDIVSLSIPEVEYLVPALGIARNTITLWTGADGDGKTYLAQVMALAVAAGSTRGKTILAPCDRVYLVATASLPSGLGVAHNPKPHF